MVVILWKHQVLNDLYVFYLLEVLKKWEEFDLNISPPQLRNMALCEMSGKFMYLIGGMTKENQINNVVYRFCLQRKDFSVSISFTK